MNYNDFQWCVRLAAPCTVRVVPSYEHPLSVPFGTLLLTYFEDESILATWCESRTQVSSEQASELMEIAKGRKVEEQPVSEIKVGDKVRVVQIIAEEDDCGRFHERVRYLGQEGEVTSVALSYADSYFVLFPDTSLTCGFRRRELKVLSVPREQPESDDVIGSLRRLSREVLRLQGVNKELRDTNKHLTEFNEQLARQRNDAQKKCEDLHVLCEQRTFWHDGSRTRKQLYTRVDELRRRLDASIIERSELKETEEKLRENLAGKIVFIGRLQARIREIRESHRNVRKDVLYVLNKGLDIQ